MLTEKQMDEIREHLSKAQNPLFFYDNDVDGLCSFLILRRFLGRGKGVAVKSYPDLNVQYARRVQELNADYVFVLDKPLISKEFIEEIDKMQIPMVWIDHHDVEGNDIHKKDNLFVYNSAKNLGKSKSFEPTTCLVYKLNERKEDMWLAVMGCIADHYTPDFISDFEKEYPEFFSKRKVKGPFEIYYTTEIGKIAQALSFGLKDSITHVVQMQNFLISCKGPGDVFQEIENNSNFRKRYLEIKNKYDSLIEKGKKEVFGNLVFFDYTGDLSISAELANELCYLYPEKYVVTAFIKGGITNISLRGKNVKDLLEKLLKQFEGASGGGHEDAAGARIKTSDLARFRESMEKEVNKNGK
ncbi:MAG: DHH family phosphoesterase [Nanoarchaeota archaeon]